MTVLPAVAAAFAGVLAGGELLVRWGIAPALTALPDHSHLLARQSLVRRLRVLVPAVMVPTVVLAVVAAVLAGGVLPWLGVGVLAVFVLVSAFGTVPINIRVDGWDAADPPADWHALVRRWQRIDVVRSTAALVAFLVLLAVLVPVR
ncbi:anthrone oxygenase family protein [Pseudonocardia dioxanivorans]|uniref:anthrone oxygenase family protein n=1 Tax=Pseudonocardia dioxanivorans TaxID=240495 RepID=UPI000CD0E057|nr:anthrone oxygenase family protein [Pseudonocardia dioxanivorans]